MKNQTLTASLMDSCEYLREKMDTKTCNFSGNNEGTVLITAWWENQINTRQETQKRKPCAK